MATSSAVRGILGASLAQVARAFDYALAELRFGRPLPATTLPARGGNLKMVVLQTTTPAVASTAFSILHTLDAVPYLVLPVLPLDTAGAMFVDLTVTQAADSQRIYLSSSIANAPITVFVEG